MSHATPFRAEDFLNYQVKAPAFAELARIWIDRMRSLGVDPSKIVHDIEMDKGQVGTGTYPDEFAWWQAGEFDGAFAEIQDFWFQHPNTVGLIERTQDHEASKSGELTVSHLVAANGDETAIAAILFIATALALERQNADHIGLSLAQFRMLHAIARSAAAFCHDRNMGHLYHRQVKYALPNSPIGVHRYLYPENDAPPAAPSPINAIDLRSAMRWMADCHVQLLQRWRPCRIRFPMVLQSDWHARIDALRRVYDARNTADAAQAEARHAAWQERQRIEKAAALEFLKKYPRCQEWRGITDARLTEDIWSKPTWELADEFGISDVAIAKECRKRGIPKPERGFWNKVTAGKIPHPGGIPPRKPTRRRGESRVS